MPVPDGLITLKTGISKFSNRLFPETDPHSTLKFPEFLLFETFINIGYFTFITPFRFLKDSDGKYKIKTNAVQQTISTVLVVSSTIYSLLSIRLLFQRDLKKNPSEAFAVIFGMMKKSFIGVWFYTFWLQRENFANFLLECQATTSPSINFARFISSAMISSSVQVAGDGGRKKCVEWKMALVSRLIVLFATSKLALEVCYTFVDWDSPTMKKPYRGESGVTNFADYVLRANIEAGWRSFLLNDTSNIPRMWQLFHEGFKIKSVSVFVILLLGTIQDYVCNMIDAFCFVGAALVFSVCRRFTQDIPKLKGQGQQEPTNFLKVLDRMSIEFMELTNVIERTNEICGPLFLLFVMGAFPSLGGFMMYKQYSSVTGVPLASIAIVSSVSMQVLVALVASEGSSKMIDYKSWLFDASLLRKMPSAWKTDSSSHQAVTLPNAVLSRLNHLHREVSSDTIGLKGGPGFFTMTHSLIGTLLGIFVTFSIIIVQFEMDMANK